MSRDPDLDVSPEPSPADRDAILAAVREVLRKEAALATISGWRLAGWTGQRAGITDFGDAVPADRRWALSARLPWGGRVFGGLTGRGETK